MELSKEYMSEYDLQQPIITKEQIGTKSSKGKAVQFSILSSHVDTSLMKGLGLDNSSMSPLQPLEVVLNYPHQHL